MDRHQAILVQDTSLGASASGSSFRVRLPPRRRRLVGAKTRLECPEAPAVLAELTMEQSNLRAALTAMLEHGQMEPSRP